VKIPDGIHGGRIQLLVSKHPARAKVNNGWIRFELPTLMDHEVVVIG
jgi:hypothetical protein